MKVSITKGDVILPLFTQELRDHIRNELDKQIKESREKMGLYGWGVTRFGSPNPEYYGDFTHRFWNDFHLYLNPDLTVRDEHIMSNRFNMLCGDVKDGKFGVLPLFSTQWDGHAFEFISGFRFDVEKCGIDFFKMGHNI